MIKLPGVIEPEKEKSFRKLVQKSFDDKKINRLDKYSERKIKQAENNYQNNMLKQKDTK